jgi:hypothetical protein
MTITGTPGKTKDPPGQGKKQDELKEEKEEE